MWHETKDEMIEFLKSIIRLDEDQCARRVAQKYLRVVDPDYYEFESKFSKVKFVRDPVGNRNLFQNIFQLIFSSTMPSRYLIIVTMIFK